MASRHLSRRRRTQRGLFWILVVLSVGAGAGMAAAASLFARKERAQPDDPDAPLFI